MSYLISDTQTAILWFLIMDLICSVCFALSILHYVHNPYLAGMLAAEIAVNFGIVEIWLQAIGWVSLLAERLEEDVGAPEPW